MLENDIILKHTILRTTIQVTQLKLQIYLLSQTKTQES